MKRVKKYLSLMRVKHYIKNLLVFAAAGCSGRLFEKNVAVPALLGFAAFCLTSSLIYIINDLRDAPKDRLHPVKKSRPIASGAVTEKAAVILSILLFLAASGISVIIGRVLSAVLLAAYLAMNIGYSFGLKDVPMIDITILAAGFLVRVMYGAAVTGIAVSDWLYLTVISVAFYCALGKRRNELKRTGSGTRTVLKNYSPEFLDKNMYMCLALANVFYALWSTDGSTAELYGGKHMVFTVPIVLLITMKYSMDVEGDSDGDPVEVLLHDRVLLCLTALYLAAMFVILYIV